MKMYWCRKNWDGNGSRYCDYYITCQGSEKKCQYMKKRGLLQIEEWSGILCSDRERKILTYRFGLNNCKKKKLREIGEELGITGQRVSQIERKLLRKLQYKTRINKILAHLEINEELKEIMKGGENNG